MYSASSQKPLKRSIRQYSENITVFRNRPKAAVVTSRRRSCVGNAFHVIGPATAKAEDLLLKHNLLLLNDSSHTYLHPATGSTSAIDLSISTPSLYLDFTWQVIADQHGSDHFPVGIHSYTAAPSVTNSTWKLSKADWATFSSKASSELGQIRPDDVEDAVEHFTDTLFNIAYSTIPKSIAFNINHSSILPLMALNGLYCADVPLSNYSLTHPLLWVGAMSSGNGYGHRYGRKRWRVLRSSGSCYQDCW